MPRHRLDNKHRWHGVGDVSGYFDVQTEAFTFDDAQGWYRPKRVQGWVWDVGGWPRPDLIALADIRPDGCFEPVNPAFGIGGHLIAVALAGSNEPENIAAVSKQTNDAQQQVETAIRKKAQEPRYMITEVLEYYDQADPRVPKSFRYTLRNRPDSADVLVETVTQNWLRVGAAGTPAAFAKRFLEGQTAVNFLGWRIENIRGLEFLNGHLPPPEQRLYAALDWILIERKGVGLTDERTALRYINGIGLKKPFSALAKSLVLRANPVLHGDFLSSDIYGKKEYVVVHPNAGVVMEHFSNLIHGSGSDAPQVDHIIPQKPGGPNCISNAQITSMHYNASKGKQTEALDFYDEAWKQNMMQQVANDPMVIYHPPATSVFRPKF